jgi:hypothetical protein
MLTVTTLIYVACTEHLVQFIIQTIECTIYIYLYISYMKCENGRLTGLVTSYAETAFQSKLSKER